MWSTQSKVFDKSVRRAPNKLTLCINLFNFSVIAKKLCWERWELYSLQNLHWLGNIYLGSTHEVDNI